MFVLLPRHLAAVSIRGKAYMYLFAHVFPAISPLAEELVYVCVSEPIGGEDSVTLLRGPIHSAAGFLFRCTPPWEHILWGKEWAWIVSKIEISARAALWTNEREHSKAGAQSNF